MKSNRSTRKADFPNLTTGRRAHLEALVDGLRGNLRGIIGGRGCGLSAAQNTDSGVGYLRLRDGQIIALVYPDARVIVVVPPSTVTPGHLEALTAAADDLVFSVIALDVSGRELSQAERNDERRVAYPAPAALGTAIIALRSEHTRTQAQGRLELREAMGMPVDATVALLIGGEAARMRPSEFAAFLNRYAPVEAAAAA